MIRHYANANYVPVMMNTCTSPQDENGALLLDRVVFGLFYVDRAEIGKPVSTKVIRQDYFVVWLNGSEEMRYYSGGPASWKAQGKLYWHDIDEFCVSDGFRGPGGCYGCEPRPKAGDPERPKHYYAPSDPGLKMNPPESWRLAFELALAVAREM